MCNKEQHFNLYIICFNCNVPINLSLHGLNGNVVSHMSVAPGFKPNPGSAISEGCFIFHRSAHLPYIVHKGGRKTSTSKPFNKDVNVFFTSINEARRSPDLMENV